MQDNTAKEISNTRVIVLVGLMGAGKSTVGRRLAKALDIPFKDSDEVIVDAAGCSVADIFEMYGEDKFRDLEKRILLKLLQSPPLVLATGGGTLVNPEVRAQIKQHAISIWLKADIEVLLERVARKNTRPLLEKGDKRAILERLITERYPLYAEADAIVDSGQGTHEAVVDNIIKILGELRRDG